MACARKLHSSSMCTCACEHPKPYTPLTGRGYVKHGCHVPHHCCAAFRLSATHSHPTRSTSAAAARPTPLPPYTAAMASIASGGMTSALAPRICTRITPTAGRLMQPSHLHARVHMLPTEIESHTRDPVEAGPFAQGYTFCQWIRCLMLLKRFLAGAAEKHVHVPRHSVRLALFSCVPPCMWAVYQGLQRPVPAECCITVLCPKSDRF